MKFLIGSTAVLSGKNHLFHFTYRCFHRSKIFIRHAHRRFRRNFTFNQQPCMQQLKWSWPCIQHGRKQPSALADVCARPRPYFYKSRDLQRYQSLANRRTTDPKVLRKIFLSWQAIAGLERSVFNLLSDTFRYLLI